MGFLILMLAAGLLLILGGANFMTDGASSLAKRLGMSDFLVGLTILSFMTSAPELVVSLTGAFSGVAPMATGNIVGSNIFNVLVIIGIVAMIKPIKIGNGVLINEIPLVILASVALLAIGGKPWLDGNDENTITRSDGILLLLFFIIFMRFTFSQAKKEKISDEPLEQAGSKVKRIPIWLALIYLFGGLAALIFGGEWFVEGAKGLAKTWGMSESLIGLTILAAGTSLPELATSVAAAVKGYPGLCVGNVIGSNIFNIFFVLGTTAAIHPLGFGNIGLFDLLVLTGSALLFWIVGWFGGHRIIKRSEGFLMFLFYIGYIIALSVS